MAQQQRRQMTSGSSTVTIACKMPNGLIMRVFDMVPTREPVMGGGMREVKVAQERPEKVLIHGPAHPQIAAPKCQIVGGYALTPGVSQEFWDAWLHQNKDSMMVKNQQIFAHSSTASAEDHAQDNAKQKSGFERLDPDNLPKGLERGKDLVTASV